MVDPYFLRLIIYYTCNLVSSHGKRRAGKTCDMMENYFSLKGKLHQEEQEWQSEEGKLWTVSQLPTLVYLIHNDDGTYESQEGKKGLRDLPRRRLDPRVLSDSTEESRSEGSLLLEVSWNHLSSYIKRRHRTSLTHFLGG